MIGVKRLDVRHRSEAAALEGRELPLALHPEALPVPARLLVPRPYRVDADISAQVCSDCRWQIDMGQTLNMWAQEPLSLIELRLGCPNLSGVLSKVVMVNRAQSSIQGHYKHSEYVWLIKKAVCVLAGGPA